MSEQSPETTEYEKPSTLVGVLGFIIAFCLPPVGLLVGLALAARGDGNGARVTLISLVFGAFWWFILYGIR